MKKKKFRHFLLKAFSMLSFASVSVVALFLGFGYRYDPIIRDIQKTSIIDISNTYGDVRVFLDDNLQTIDLPYLVKDVLPGEHLLTIKKLFFLPWSRIIDVNTDVVSKVSDVLLFPEDFSSSVKILNNFLEDAVFYFGKNQFVVVRPKQNFLTMVVFQNDGTVQQNEVKFDYSDVLNIQIFPENQLLVYFKDGSLGWLEVGQNILTTFTLPTELVNTNIYLQNKHLYTLFSGNLYAIPLEKLDSKKSPIEDFVPFKILSDIIVFVKNNDDLYYLSRGGIYVADALGKNTIMLSKISSQFSNFALYPGNGKDFLVLRNGENRDLYLKYDQANMEVITHFLKGKPLLNSRNQILYTLTNNVVFFFDPRVNEKTFVHRFGDDFELLAWFSDKGHFLYREKNDVYLSDLSFSNVYKVTHKDELSHFFVQNEKLFFLDQNSLKLFSLTEAVQ